MYTLKCMIYSLVIEQCCLIFEGTLILLFIYLIISVMLLLPLNMKYQFLISSIIKNVADV